MIDWRTCRKNIQLDEKTFQKALSFWGYVWLIYVPLGFYIFLNTYIFANQHDRTQADREKINKEHFGSLPEELQKVTLFILKNLLVWNSLIFVASCFASWLIM